MLKMLYLKTVMKDSKLELYVGYFRKQHGRPFGIDSVHNTNRTFINEKNNGNSFVKSKITYITLRYEFAF